MNIPGTIPLRRSMRIGANLTSMIDIIFLLVVFFVLVSRISEVEQIPLELPEPANPATSNASDQARAIVNMPADVNGSATVVRLNT
ncbi:MAG: biopolymer transporter ExbD, partial [Phycisphaerales bacterium]|nr:biopolymer transporter ExbD [Phycisphaerales bacterium]